MPECCPENSETAQERHHPQLMSHVFPALAVGHLDLPHVDPSQSPRQPFPEANQSSFFWQAKFCNSGKLLETLQEFTIQHNNQFMLASQCPLPLRPGSKDTWPSPRSPGCWVEAMSNSAAQNAPANLASQSARALPIPQTTSSRLRRTQDDILSQLVVTYFV